MTQSCFVLLETDEGKPPIKVKFEIPYFTVSGIQVISDDLVRFRAGFKWLSKTITRLLFLVIG